ncbi:MAG: F0F1 ATP synthase subunit B [Saprospiraceae bacterium]|nr:F0F1 ATP synthase subunit B [Saprospiraceae bacterium]MBK8451314.1 F0F1 ATP synthase subunit B [Saprospiraceae bacterium]MBK9220783.1 F0F1 ATP synthase subunit B [Saprospiraceae bacterium]MBK9722372.1 F0F1 ATP synthase subunit B [Saprospiraceae bacterium]
MINFFYSISLVDFSPLKPDFGLLFWSSVFFLLFWFLIGKMAFKPIVKALKDRQDEIQNSLDAAKQARSEMSNLKVENEKILAEAREEKMNIIKDAKESATIVIAEARDKAKEEAHRIMQQAKQDIETAKKAAMVDVKNEIGVMALQIAERVIRKELKDKQPNIEYVNKLVDEISN